MLGAKLDGCHMGLPYGYRMVAHMAPIWVSYDNATGGITDGGGSLFQTCGPATANNMSHSDVVVRRMSSIILAAHREPVRPRPAKRKSSAMADDANTTHSALFLY